MDHGGRGCCLTFRTVGCLPRRAARQFDGQAPLLEDARGWEAF
jgi:hypothetical protein